MTYITQILILCFRRLLTGMVTIIWYTIKIFKRAGSKKSDLKFMSKVQTSTVLSTLKFYLMIESWLICILSYNSMYFMYFLLWKHIYFKFIKMYRHLSWLAIKWILLLRYWKGQKFWAGCFSFFFKLICTFNSTVGWLRTQIQTQSCVTSNHGSVTQLL